MFKLMTMFLYDGYQSQLLTALTLCLGLFTDKLVQASIKTFLVLCMYINMYDYTYSHLKHVYLPASTFTRT